MITGAIVFTGLSAVTKNFKFIGFPLWCPQVEIRACAGMITSGLLLAMVAIILIDGFRALFKDDTEVEAR